MSRQLGSWIVVMVVLAGCRDEAESSADVRPALSHTESHRRHLSPYLDLLARLDEADLVVIASDIGDAMSRGPASAWDRIGPHKIIQRGRSLGSDDRHRLKQLLLSPQSFEWPRPPQLVQSHSTFGIRLRCGERVILLHYLPEHRILALNDGFNGDAWAMVGESLASVLDRWSSELQGAALPK